MRALVARLYLQMVVVILSLICITGALLVGIWATFYGLFAYLGLGVASQLSAIITGAVIATIGYLEYVQQPTVEHLTGAEPVRPADAPELHQLMTKVATQLTIPVPTLALSDRDTPEAVAVGFHPQTVHLVLSQGTLDSLATAEELESVIAHELAHVNNWDAMVMTIASVPVVLADGLRSQAIEFSKSGGWIIVTVPLAILSTGVWFVGNMIIARLSRVREQVADRSAVEITGSPAALAAALERLDQGITTTPDHDLRTVSAVSSLSILPLEPEEPVLLGPEGSIEPLHWKIEKRLRYFFKTHPATEDRIETLSQMGDEE
ncbi:M48 family metallopeptidase [Natrialba asiatica]|uniref:Heat shock protein HtpX n=1 Tax=Natrialba asiatica (strain ATCC 700177 / DSM 12278 / JCM 9576 / FERM P-10747 / NBRC 102637 / 172P1) TaxID=29540 RepID=M0B582_NATA1|nr:M48 family metalloprotease [Natrialba asiatica]ELZ05682.1 heat shock protein HtpX [Natrialba asiatica DSM 12278]